MRVLLGRSGWIEGGRFCCGSGEWGFGAGVYIVELGLGWVT